MERLAKIVCTLGPSSSDEEMICKLILAGMDVARLNFSHGTHDFHAHLIKTIRKLSVELNQPITILQDLQGPKLRVGIIPDEGIVLKPSEPVFLYVIGESEPQQKPGVAYLPLHVPNLARSVKSGSRILLDDGNLELRVINVNENLVEAKVIIGGKITSNKGVNLPGTDLHIPPFTEKDRKDLEFGLSQNVDCVAISFVENADDVENVRQAMREMKPDATPLPIIAKLERPEAIQHLHEIIHAADGVMVARGDLGVETSASSVPIIQKEIIRSANRHAKVVITATQMLDSMIHNPRPTRAEASDVANAIFDGTDAVMLSGETASGSYPLESVKMMDQIVREAEKHAIEWSRCDDLPEETLQDDAVTITRAARELAHNRSVSNIAVFTQTGKTALLMSKVRPRVPILACTPEPQTYRLLNLFWGVIPEMVPYASSLEEMVVSVDEVLETRSHLKPGQQVIMITGFPVGTKRLPNLALLHTIGEKV